MTIRELVQTWRTVAGLSVEGQWQERDPWYRSDEYRATVRTLNRCADELEATFAPPPQEP